MRSHLWKYFFFTAATAFAQMQIPMLGYLPDAGSLRPILGIPSAGAIGNPLVTDREFSLVVLLPGRSAALAVEKESGDTVVLGVRAETAMAVTRMEGGLPPAPDRIDVSPSGAAAILTNTAEGRIRVVTGLPDAPVVAREIDTAFVGEAPTALAVADDGEWVVGIWPAGVYAFGPRQQAMALPISGDVSALAFFHGGQDLALAGATGIYRVAGIGGLPLVTTLYPPPLREVPPDSPPPYESPISIAITPDNQRLLAVLRSSGGIASVDLATGQPTVTACECVPVGLHALGGTVFRLTALGGGSIKIFDAASDSTWFVPLALPQGFKGFGKGGKPPVTPIERPRQGLGSELLFDKGAER